MDPGERVLKWPPFLSLLPSLSSGSPLGLSDIYVDICRLMERMERGLEMHPLPFPSPSLSSGSLWVYPKYMSNLFRNVR
ncbi:hypothetical protein K435DRAFT_784081 [Dendrothele bispora CBS 962.96]|uniref:Uncharacterized protein n=1 Tax=Dendrothele bispora (strain CBS 962.96) TaxID=1314807 RepID=A0A4S8L5Q4_DENBC|nr:hypothetical protein K435DRAFT_784081 [Dendrothele bispora CBS 962.96]